VVAYTPGGGGYGPPLERDPARVLKDVEEGWITVARARDAYGVVFDADGLVDAAATRAIRESKQDVHAR
jgi:N-methylhydantoinase B